MNIEACYNKMGADYAEVKSRLPSDAFIKRFALKFLDDPTFALLEKSLAEENVDEAFRAAHTLKGITQTSASVNSRRWRSRSRRSSAPVPWTAQTPSSRS